jgi:hypothetical protein
MAGDDDRNWVAIVRHAHGAKRIRLADGAGDVGISARLSVGNRQQRASRLAGNRCREGRARK